MSTLSNIKLHILQHNIVSNDDYWYITKQQLNVSNLCRFGEILSRWDPESSENFECFFNREKKTNEFNQYIGGAPHRATKNLNILGLKFDNTKYDPSDLTPVFRRIQQLTGGNYANIQLYQEIIDDQLEKIFIKTPSITIYPMMFTFKVLLTLGDVTGDYSISIAEFKTFVATAHNWNEFFMTADSILRYRSDDEYKRAVDQSSPKQLADKIRFNLAIANHSLIKADDNKIYIPLENINEVRLKLAKFEMSNPSEIDVDKAYSRLTSNTIFSPQQQIFFGAPGVGKSHHLKSVYKNEDNIIRITFHPETDYASFVGCYKPQSEDKEIVYKFQGQAFTETYVKAWKRYVGDDEPKDTYLVIEEINRGNCAQIFGDIFQLLDRNEQGFSDYSVIPDKDLQSYLKTQFQDVANDLAKVDKGIAEGTSMILPPNLHILATMNTSDQSLFPIDSAFKRRWDWVYMPIDTNPTDPEGKQILREIHTSKFAYDWGTFLKEVNSRIYTTTLSEDKQLGFWFVKPHGKDGIISAYDFVSKVLFFLWNDIYKDYGDDATSIFYFSEDGNPDSKDKSRHTFRDFTPKFQNVNNSLVDAFIQSLEVKGKPLSTNAPAENSGDMPIENPAATTQSEE